jgi:hypothetical protein
MGMTFRMQDKHDPNHEEKRILRDVEKRGEEGTVVEKPSPTADGNTAPKQDTKIVGMTGATPESKEHITKPDGSR